MNHCKHCQAELPEGSTICPNCGREVSAEGKTPLTAGKAVLAIATLTVALVLMAGVLLKNSQTPPVPEDIAISATAAAPEATEAPTVPADGNPDDVTCKGTYTAADEDVIKGKDTVVATAGSRQLTNEQLQVFYWMQVRNFFSQYGAYAAYFGLDIQQPLDTQMCDVLDEPMTWQQYFLGEALNAWKNYSAMAEAGQADGFELPENQQAALQTVPEDLDVAALESGFETGDEMLHASLGNAATVDGYRNFMELYYRANGYYNQIADSITAKDEELETYFTENAEAYAQSGLTKDTKSVNVRHILLYPEGADGTNIFTEEFSEEAWAAGEAAAQALLNQWLEGDATEESFAALANEHSQDPGSNTNGGLYEDVAEGEMVQAFNDWCFDAERQIGDTGVVRTEYGFHVMFFSGSKLLWKDVVRSDYVNETAGSKASAIAEKDPVRVDYSAILLASADLI